MSQQAPAVDHWVLGFNWLLDRKAVQVLLSVVEQAVNLNAKKITLALSSPGGAPDQAFYAYEVLVSLHPQVELVTHNVAMVQSAAMTLFMAGSKRCAVPNATFLVHETTHNTGASVTIDHVTFGAASIEADDARAIAIMAERTGKDPSAVRKWFKGQKLRDTAFAAEANIITAVEPLQFTASSKFHQVVL